MEIICSAKKLLECIEPLPKTSLTNLLIAPPIAAATPPAIVVRTAPIPPANEPPIALPDKAPLPAPPKKLRHHLLYLSHHHSWIPPEGAK